jgi:hypothetical protein
MQKACSIAHGDDNVEVEVVCPVVFSARGSYYNAMQSPHQCAWATQIDLRLEGVEAAAEVLGADQGG